VIGGSGAITACGAARLGVQTALVSLVGNDHFGRFMLEAVAGTGVDVSGCVTDEGRPTGVTVVLSRGDDRAILTAPGTIAALSGEHVDLGQVRRARHLHVSSYYLQTRLRGALPDLMAAARAAGASTSLDTNWDPSERWNSGLSTVLPMVGHLFCNEQEADALGGADQIVRTGTSLVIKRGARGATLVGRGGTMESVSPAVDAVDATGAGDSFDAGFIAGLLAGRAADECLRLACACGALSTRALGGTAAQPTLAEADGAW
jgi:sugar/nucleoside kinase (ribokinase family)